MVRKEKIIYKELSYLTVGVLYEVYNEMGFGYAEKHYQKAISVLLAEKKIKFRQQVPFNIIFRGNVIGRYFLDFIIDDKIALEIKKGPNFSKKNIEQIKGYLKATGFRLAILANFTPRGVKFFRLLNDAPQDKP